MEGPVDEIERHKLTKNLERIQDRIKALTACVIAIGGVVARSGSAERQDLMEALSALEQGFRDLNASTATIELIQAVRASVGDMPPREDASAS
jgi:hypothetical protein